MVQWDPTFSVGHAVLDAQHRHLLHCCAQAQRLASTARGDPEGRLHHLLDELFRYTRIHFTTEESLLRCLGYPDLAAHQQEHLHYREQLADLLYAGTTGELAPETLTHLLTRWWLEHILHTDMAYRSFFSGQTGQRRAA